MLSLVISFLAGISDVLFNNEMNLEKLRNGFHLKHSESWTVQISYSEILRPFNKASFGPWK